MLLRRLSFLLTVLVLGPLLFLMLLTFLLVDQQPVVVQATNPDPQQLINSNKAFKRVIHDLENGTGGSISLSHRQLENLVSYASHSIPLLRGRYNYTGTGVLLALSIRLPAKPFGGYLNITTGVANGLDLLQGKSTVGHVSLSNRTFYGVISFAMGLILEQELVKLIDTLIKDSALNKHGLNVGLGKVDRVLLQNVFGGDFKLVSDIAIDKNKFKRVQFYYNYLSDFASSRSEMRDISIIEPMRFLFTRVRQQSTGDPVEENMNALVALAIMVGDGKIDKLLINITGVSTQGKRHLSNVVLAGRGDLTLHFIYSVIIQILGNSDISYAMGELKEIMDMDKGGSGFSFTDLAADRAGVQFGLMATDSLHGARNLQRMMASMSDESSFFPDLKDLPDSLRISTFESHFRDTTSLEYKRMVRDIDRRIQRLPLYSGLGQ